MRSYFSITDAGRDRKLIAIGNPEIEFSLLIDGTKLRDPKWRETITAWALGLFSCPGAHIAKSTIDELLDYLEEHWPLQQSLFPRPKLREW
jgi:hypothetical protein